MANLVNLTKHNVNVVMGDETIVIPPSGVEARVSSEQTVISVVNGIPVMQTVYGEIEGLPEPANDTVYIVSTLVLLALRDKGVARCDVVSPNTSPASVVRDADGRVIGVKSFQVL